MEISINRFVGQVRPIMNTKCPNMNNYVRSRLVEERRLLMTWINKKAKCFGQEISLWKTKCYICCTTPLYKNKATPQAMVDDGRPLLRMLRGPRTYRAPYNQMTIERKRKKVFMYNVFIGSTSECNLLLFSSNYPLGKIVFVLIIVIILVIDKWPKRK